MRVSEKPACLVVYLLLIGSWTIQAKIEDEVPKVPELSDSELLLSKWKDLEKGFKDGIQSIVKKAMPTVLRFSMEADIEPKCQGAFLALVQGLLNMKSWAFEMLDASGKPQSGMLMGTITSMGSYDECVNIAVKHDYKNEIKFRGKYCKLQIKPPLPPKPKFYTMHHYVKDFDNFTNEESIITKLQSIVGIMFDVPVRFGICLPSSCSEEDIGNIIHSLAEKVHMDATIVGCEEKDVIEWTRTQMVIGSLILALAFLNITCTLFHIIYDKCANKNDILKKPEKPLTVKLACAFSFLKSFPSLFTSSSSLEPSFLHAMRALSLGWVLLGSVFLFLNTAMLSQMLYAREYANTFWLQFILNGTLGIETLMFTTAYLLGYSAKMRKNDSGNFIYFTKMIVARVFRLLPIILTVIAMAIMLPLTTSGPMWREVAKPYEENCMQTWWANVLFINNFLVDPNTRCLYNSWFLSCEMQLFIVGLLFIATMSNVRRRISLTIAAFLIFISIIITGFITAYFKYPPTVLFSQIDFVERSYYESLIQQKPFSHLSTWFMGLIAGYYFTKLPKVQVKSIFLWLGWMAAITCLSAMVFGVFEWNRRENYDTVLATMYSCLYRPGWSLCLIWICFVCSNGNASTVNSVLSWGGWIPLSRIFYFFFLIFPLFQDMVFAQGRELLQVSLYLALFLFSGVFVLGGLTSLLCSLMVRQPVLVIIGLLSSPSRSVNLLPDKQSPVKKAPAAGYDRSMSVTSEVSLVSNLSTGEIPPPTGARPKRESCVPLSINME